MESTEWGLGLFIERSILNVYENLHLKPERIVCITSEAEIQSMETARAPSVNVSTCMFTFRK